MELLPLTLASGWASGVNAYATVLLLGMFGRFALKAWLDRRGTGRGPAW